jgi:hypothetical protein
MWDYLEIKRSYTQEEYEEIECEEESSWVAVMFVIILALALVYRVIKELLL